MLTSPQTLTDVMDPGWAHALAPVMGQIRSLSDTLLQESLSGNGYLPAEGDILRAFTYPFAEVKVLIVGQDPYPTPGHAMGLAFSVAPGVAPPASLRNIYREMTDDLGSAPPTTGDLSGWARQGVCLLNRVLTVKPGEAGSHRNRGWETVTECAIRALASRGKPLVAVLWGKDAQSITSLLGEVPIIASPHPSPLSSYRGFFGSKPFSRVNQLLSNAGADPIAWEEL